MLIAAGMTGCNENNNSTPEDQGAEQSEVTFTFEVTDKDGNVSAEEITTTEAKVGAALFEAGITDNAEFVTYINGVRADWTEDGHWWEFFVDGVSSMVGVNEVDAEAGKVYAFIYTPA